ncbi:glycosyltransferase family 2 protein [Cobetia sp. 5-25-4-2]|uniref:glycosyltransferase family 2 protein n=1 Tax=Cobetia sp. 5-25-4-2 TaxID=2737459 RepID=UPI0015963EC9|nr:glycosyltransferase family 2 protein [Cobetia sp. 5-25-4-2]
MLPKVCVVSIVKDEASYIADWVAHHVYFGFDNFHFVVNRTTDATVSIIEGLAKVYSGITYEFADWIDICHPKLSGSMQQISYAKAYLELDADYFMFLDLDEYWASNDFTSCVKKNIISNDFPNVIYYQWHAELGVQEAFKNFAEDNRYYLMSLGKSLIKKGTNIDMFRIHVPVTSDGIIMSDGTPFKAKVKPPQFVQPDVSAVRDEFVVHRMFRSEKEYLSKLMNGSPGSKKSIKHNRKKGFVTQHASEFNFSIDSETFNKYEEFVTSFTSTLRTDIRIAQERLLARNDDLYVSIPSLYVQDSSLLKSSLTGISDGDIMDLVEDLDNMEPSHESYQNRSQYYSSINREMPAKAFKIGLGSFSS